MPDRRAHRLIKSETGEQRIQLPSAVIYVHWEFVKPLETMEWDITVTADPGSSVGEYLALFSGSIDGSDCYLGLQTDLARPDSGKGVGKGLIFSTWWSFDVSDLRVAEDGFHELGTHEGRFVGIRRPYEWTTGDYRVTLSRAAAEAVGCNTLDWFNLSIQPLAPIAPGDARPDPLGPGAWIGAIRFPRRSARRAATIDPEAVMFLEVYSGARTWSDVAPWHVDVMAYGDGARCPSGRTEYPRPYNQRVRNASVRFDPGRARVDLSLGAGAVVQAPPARWP